MPDNADLLTEALSAQLGRKVAIAQPQRGEKAGLVEQAARNAREALARRMAESASQAALLEGLAEAFGLDGAPERIEVYDNSHIMGTNAVGAMIVAGPRGLPEVAVPQVQHPRRRPDPGRRLRDDARGADPALRAAGARRTRTGSRTPGRTWC